MVSAFQFFTGEYTGGVRFPRDRTQDNQAPQQAAEMALLSQDPDIGNDLRRLNGRAIDPVFDPFWAKAQEILEEYKRVHDRRHGEYHRQ